jgi:hypothetical protein
MTSKLYRVTTRGMQTSSTGVAHGISYVVATDPTSAYEIVRNYLNEKDYGFSDDRELEKIELLAEEYEFTKTKTILFFDDFC